MPVPCGLITRVCLPWLFSFSQLTKGAVDLGVFRNPRYPLGKPYLKEYWKHVPISEPEEDVDSRNTLYMLRNQILLSILYPHDPKLREM
jgi:hypothetical protein